MAQQTILEMAADVREKHAALEQTCDALRDASGEWTDHGLAGSDALKVATDGLRNAWCVLDRIHRLAKEELKRIKSHNA